MVEGSELSLTATVDVVLIKSLTPQYPDSCRAMIIQASVLLDL